MKKVLSSILAIAMLISSIGTVLVFADEPKVNVAEKLIMMENGKAEAKSGDISSFSYWKEKSQMLVSSVGKGFNDFFSKSFKEWFDNLCVYDIIVPSLSIAMIIFTRNMNRARPEHRQPVGFAVDPLPRVQQEQPVLGY